MIMSAIEETIRLRAGFDSLAGRNIHFCLLRLLKEFLREEESLAVKEGMIGSLG